MRVPAAKHCEITCCEGGMVSVPTQVLLASLQPKRMWPYDMWSVGVLWLELLLGTPHVFQASAWVGMRVALCASTATACACCTWDKSKSHTHADFLLPHTACRRCCQVDGRTQALLDHRLRLAQLPAADAAAALLLRGLMELCIYPPQPLGSTSSHAGTRSGSGTSSSDDGRSAQGAGDLTSDTAAERVAEAAAAAGSASHTAEQQLSSKHGENSLPVSWSCTDEAVLQVHQLICLSLLVALLPGHRRLATCLCIIC